MKIFKVPHEHGVAEVAALNLTEARAQVPGWTRPPPACELRGLRVCHGLTQVEAAALVHKSTRHWQSYELGEHAVPRDVVELFLFKLRAPEAVQRACLRDVDVYV